MRFRVAPLAAVAAAIWLVAAGCRRSPLADGRDAAPDLTTEAPTRGDSPAGPADASLDVPSDAPPDGAADLAADLGAGDVSPTDGSAAEAHPPDAPADVTDTADAPRDMADAPLTVDAPDAPADRSPDLSGGDARDVRPQDQPCGPLGFNCAPFACDVSLGLCKAICASDDDCSSGVTCRSGRCGGNDLTVCTANDECKSGFCSQGVCCNTACNQICASCALAGTIGTCTPVANGSLDPLNRCPGDNRCDGAGRCLMPVCTADPQCAVRHWCEGGRCLPCAATCSSNADCASGICIRRNECSYCAASFDAGPGP